MTVKLKLPPGFYKNGTSYSGAGRYIDGDLVRWHEGVIKAIGGWAKRQGSVPLWLPGAEAVRSGIVVDDLLGGLSLLIGTNQGIYSVSNSNVVSNVTPAGFVGQPGGSVTLTGYGLFQYSYGQYGTPRPSTQVSSPITFSWGFANWGAWPMAVSRDIQASPLYVKRDTDALFVPVSGAPTGASDVIVTDERFAMVLGQDDDPRYVSWSDQEDFETWAPAIDNQAGGKRLSGTGSLKRAVNVLDQVLILGSNDALVARYIGPPYVYGFDRVGDKCGIIGPNAIAVTDTFAMWLGDLNFWQFDGTVQRVSCEVIGHYLETRDKSQRSKTVGFTVTDYSEVWFLYQSTDSTTGEPDSYIIYNYAIDKWYFGKMDRTFGIDADPLSYVFMVDPVGQLYDHDIRSAGRGGRSFHISTGPLETDNGRRLTGVSYVHPDADTTRGVNMELSVYDNTDEPPRYSRQFQLSHPVSTHGIMGRDIRMRLSGNQIDPNITIGDFRVDTLPVGGPRR